MTRSNSEVEQWRLAKNATAIRKAAHRKMRRQIATHVLNGMLASAPIVDRIKVNKKAWVKAAYEFTDELIKQGDKS